MRHTILLTTLCMLSYALSSCDAIIGSVGELPDDIQNCQSDASLCPANTNDPSSSSFTLPEIRLADGFSLNTPFTLNANNVTLSWVIVDNSGNPIDFDYSFQFAYARPGQTIAAGDFQELGASTSISLNNLLETFNDEYYSFQIKGNYNDGSVSKDTTFSGQFAVDVVQERGLLFNPTQLVSNTDGSYTANIYLDNIQASDDLTAFTLAIDYSSQSFNVSDNDIQLFDDANGFLGRDNAEVILITEYSTNLLLLNIGMAGSNLTPLSGGGAVCRITFNPTSSFTGQESFAISPSSTLRNSLDGEIPIITTVGATITQ